MTFCSRLAVVYITLSLIKFSKILLLLILMYFGKVSPLFTPYHKTHRINEIIRHTLIKDKVLLFRSVALYDKQRVYILQFMHIFPSHENDMLPYIFIDLYRICCTWFPEIYPTWQIMFGGGGGGGCLVVCFVLFLFVTECWRSLFFSFVQFTKFSVKSIFRTKTTTKQPCRATYYPVWKQIHVGTLTVFIMYRILANKYCTAYSRG